ncbi:SIMPL domain-containing protein [Mycolicibacterium mengxianglii]|uniref:SIMPL domain-containing protein n=1 Tax=Mycolicibacterium mengxianglii TaxID=2736649 RepID=UPI0018D10CCA|nr:SIMPL domain-containing protein [Mycolicibacterium mengxianglii]
MPIAGNVRRRARFALVLLTGLVAATLTACDSVPTPPLPGDAPRQVTVIGSGEVQGTPDTLTASAAISFLAQDVTTAMNQTNERQQTVINALVDAGIDAKDIATTNVSLQPQYGPDGVTSIVGYEASNSVDVTIRDISVASRVLALIVSNGGDATRINSVSFSIDDDSQLVKDARTRAFEDARDRAQQYADLSGMRLGKVISISEASGGTTPPPPMPMERAMASPVPLSPGQQTVGFSVTVIWELS